MKNNTFFKNTAIFTVTLAMLTGIGRVNAMSVLEFGDQGQEVYALQIFLSQQGFFTVSATGNFYGYTLKAVQDFQRVNKLSVTGVYDEDTQALVTTISEKLEKASASSQEITNDDQGDSVDSVEGLPLFDEELESKS